MRFLFPILLVAACLGCGCAATKQEASFETVPPASNVDTALGSLATVTGAKIYEQREEEKDTTRNRQTSPATADKPILTPSSGVTGKVMVYNAPGRFVVLSFPAGQMPAIDTRLFVYRNDLKTGEIKITGPQRGENIVADLVAGEARAGDEVRDK